MPSPFDGLIGSRPALTDRLQLWLATQKVITLRPPINTHTLGQQGHCTWPAPQSKVAIISTTHKKATTTDHHTPKAATSSYQPSSCDISVVLSSGSCPACRISLIPPLSTRNTTLCPGLRLTQRVWLTWVLATGWPLCWHERDDKAVMARP